MRPAFDVVHPVLAQLRLEACGAAPTRVLAALIGEHLLGHAVFRDRRAVYFQHVLRRLAAKQVQPHHVARVIIQKADQVGVLASQAEGEDIGLPHLVGSGTLKETRLGGIAPRLRPRLLEQLLLMESPADRLPAHRQKQYPPQELADFLDAQVGMMTLQLDDFGLDRCRHLGRLTPRTSRLGL
jgi:hypothetical protein